MRESLLLKPVGRIYLCLSALIFLGCGAMQNRTIDDLRQPEYFYKEIQIQLSLLDIQESLYTYANTCRPVSELAINPANPQIGTFVLFGVGGDELSPYSVVDFVEDDDGATTVTAYAYTSNFAKSMADELLVIISDPSSCSKNDRLGLRP